MIRLPRTAKGQTVIEDYKEDQVQERYLVTPAQVIELKALMGDAATIFLEFQVSERRQPPGCLQNMAP